MPTRSTSIVLLGPFLCVLVCCGAAAHSQEKAAPRYPAHLPYSFSNFPWWTDAELRAELKKRIPGLGDEVATTTAAEGRIRSALTVMLKEKGIAAEVQSQEPSPSAFQPPSPVLLQVPEEDRPPAGAPAVNFLLWIPKVLVGNIAVECNAADAQTSVEKQVESWRGQGFSQVTGSFSNWQVERALRELGYFGAQVLFRHTAPFKVGDHITVDLAVIVDLGPKYRIGSIAADGGPLFEGKDLSQFFSVHTGDSAIPHPFGQLEAGLRSFYEQNGFADVQIKTSPILDRVNATVSYALQVISGPVYHLRSLKIQKLSTEQETHVRDLLEMKVGDVYQQQAISDLYRKLRGDPSFKDRSFSYSPTRDRAHAAIDLTLDFSRMDGPATVTIQ